jgi:short-subunit dehydrogenase
MKNILISGGSKGVGLALITPFAQKNYNVILFIINLKRP